MMALVVVSIVTVCPLMGCQGDTAVLSKSCCDRTTAQSCPYSLIENGKTAPVAFPLSIVGFQRILSGLPIPDSHAFSDTSGRSPNSTRLYLRIRVLLI